MAPQTLPSAVAAASWLAVRVTATLRTDSRAVRAGDGFLAWPGHAGDGRRHVGAALAAGAAACLVEAEGAATYGFDDARIAALPRLKENAGAVAAACFGDPGARLEIVAATGTNGKTSTAWWTAQALTQLGRRCGFVGTLGAGEPPRLDGQPEMAIEATGLTTPDAVTLQREFKRFADAGLAACAIEASSIGLVEHRLAAAPIKVALYTNFTRDHLDFHGSMTAYWAAKRRLFDWPGLAAAVINIDDEQGAALAIELGAKLGAGPGAGQARRALELWTVSTRGPAQGSARLSAQGLHYDAGGLAFEVVEGESRVALRSRLVGDYNANNLLVVIGGLRALGVPLRDACAAAAAVTPVPGRLQRVAGSDVEAEVEVIVDYAHTPDALEQVLAALRPLAAARGARLWCVFGCGGNRDATKRPLMGAIAARGADRVVVTSDNPRDEAPDAILAQILAGVVGRDDVEVYEDRREAIRRAVTAAAAGDVVLLAGKGHEDYQEIAGERRHFSDLEEAAAALRLRAGAGA
ncbi:MAG: UDP-N-acetylmuramoyl-L-alanyl-D-glutamate--2,6-diaminopimelate ligase [Burkholderiales bacterium]|nr:UDP-N-acetylmuramoyl-L-alanyl-D-glutamate--2,6-diaminopimelate ligase [Burkholderiales bacterium]